MLPRSLEDFAGETRPSGDQLNYKNCPVCGSDGWNVYVNPDNGGWFCFAGGHNLGGFVEVSLGDNPGAQLLQTLAGQADTVEWYEIELPPWHELSGGARRYLHSRGVMDATIRTLGLVEWEDKSRILFPYFVDGALVYWNSRRYSDMMAEGPPYLALHGKHPLYTPSYKGDKLPTVLVEGVFDAIAVTQAGYRAVALGGKSLPRYLVDSLLTIAQKYGIINVFLDSDALARALRIRERLYINKGIEAVRIRLCPAGSDPGDMTPDEIQEILE